MAMKGFHAVLAIIALITLPFVIVGCSRREDPVDPIRSNANSFPEPQLPSHHQIQIQSGAFHTILTENDLFHGQGMKKNQKERHEAILNKGPGSLSMEEWAALLEDLRSGVIGQDDLGKILKSPKAQRDPAVQAAAVERLLSAVKPEGKKSEEIVDLLGPPSKTTPSALEYVYTDGEDVDGRRGWRFRISDGKVVKVENW